MDANQSLTITLTKDCVVTLTSDNPNLDSLIEAFIENKDSIDINNISVESSNSKFDKESFKDILISSFNSFSEDLKLEKEKYDLEINKLTSDKSSNENT